MKNVTIALLLFFCTAGLTAQESISFGPMVGLNFSQISDVKGGSSEHKTGFVAGAQLTHSHINNWGIGAALLYSQEGVDIVQNSQTTEVGLTYLRLPVKGFIFFRDNADSFRPKIFAGPSFAFLLDSETEIEGTDQEVETRDMYNKFDVGLALGAGFNVRLAEGTWLNFDAGYTYGLLDVAESGNDGANRGIAITTGVAFGF